MAESKKIFWQKLFENCKSYVIILAGTFLSASALDMFLVPNKIATGGVSGIATVVHVLAGWPVGLIIIILNVPLFLAGTYYFGIGFGWRSLLSTMVFSLFTDVFTFLPVPTHDPILASIYGGALMGAGLGLVFAGGATTGGSDITAALAHRFYSRFTIGQYIYAFDLFVVVLAGTAFRNYDLSLYALTSIFVSSKMVDSILEGVNYAKTVFIVSGKSEEIASAIMRRLGKGVTALSGRGMYTGREKKVLLCVVKREQIAQLKQLLKEIDPEAFMFLTDAREVLGKGFKERY